MRRRRKQHKAIKLERQKRYLREQARLTKVLKGVGFDLSIKDIHWASGLSEKNIRKIMMENPSEITFTLLKKGNNNERNK